MGHSSVEIYIHVIFSTKNRLPLIPQDLENRLHGYISGIAKEKKVPILKINGMEDHIHILLKLHASVAISELLKELKSYSAAWMKKQGVKDFAWQEGYGAFSCSVTHIEALTKYIENQKEHHKIHTFADEITNLNRIWGSHFAPEVDFVRANVVQHSHTHELQNTRGFARGSLAFILLLLLCYAGLLRK